MMHETWNRVDEAGERARLILDATPLGCILLDAELHIIDCNEEATRLFGFNDKRKFMDCFFELSPERQPDGQLSTEKGKNLIYKALKTGRYSVSWAHQMLDGTPIPAETTFVRVKYGDGYVVAGFIRDMREYKQMLKDIEQRDILLSSVNLAITLLLQAEPEQFEGALWSSMGIMADAVGADRVRLWKNYVEDGKLYCNQLYEWSEGAEPQQGKDITQRVPFEEDLPGWEAILTKGECINKLTRDMTITEQERLSAQNILSILIVPVFVQDTF